MEDSLQVGVYGVLKVHLAADEDSAKFHLLLRKWSPELAVRDIEFTKADVFTVVSEGSYLRRIEIPRGEFFDTFSNDTNTNKKDAEEAGEEGASDDNINEALQEEEDESTQNRLNANLEEVSGSDKGMLGSEKPIRRQNMEEATGLSINCQPLPDMFQNCSNSSANIPASSTKEDGPGQLATGV
ncbi:hypothetical protein FEM48_Zijuj11G0072400 [Ziziphus jujuba var. spinosa]|uniref:Uncharacterized protein n=1 Tax=Ziziphus jujuba var. spinosa TaxID=714518 RepID=A0A978UHK4_ZIZJJ|nr:hypothetical protein FEM48_Zijuj11G0072400 [Ziziphus jujuba var. spinosa]